MTAKSAIRDSVRRRLEDVALAPLWDNATLDDAMTDALKRYGSLVPQEEQSAIPLAAGLLSFAIAGLESGSAIVRVIDPTGTIVPRIQLTDATNIHDAGQCWRWWAGQIRLLDRAVGGTWIVEWIRPRLLPPGDSDAMPVQEDDIGAFTLLAVGSALRRRAIEEAKRGGRGVAGLIELAAEWERMGEDLCRGIDRSVRSYVLVPV